METSIKYVIVCDLETGGLPSKEKKPFYDIPITEIAIAVVDMKNLEIIDRFTQILAPYKDGLIYSAEAAAITGLTEDIISREGVSLDVFFKSIKDLFKKYTNKRLKAILCGHNFQGFDYPFLQNLFEYKNESISEYIGFVEDTMKLAYYGSLEQINYKLGTCCTARNIELTNAHRALADTESNALLFIEYIKSLRNLISISKEAKEEFCFRDKFQLG